MQSANVDPKITVTVRHENVTDSLRDYAERKIEGIHLDYPRIIEAKAILDVQKNRHVAEIILFCANHITIDASTETEDMYKSIDGTIDKIARRMRKFKTRLLKKHRPKPVIQRKAKMIPPAETKVDPVADLQMIDLVKEMRYERAKIDERKGRG